MKELVEYIVRLIVDNPEQITVSEVPNDGWVIIRLQVAPEDMGRVIGKQGHIIRAIRTLLRVAAIKRQTRAVLEIV